MTRARDLADSADKDIAGTLTLDDLTVGGTAYVTGDLTVDTDTLYVDTTNDRVGINASSPSSPLHVVGDSSVGFLGGGIRINDTNNSSDWFIGGAGSGKFQIAEAVTGSTRMVIDTSGNVGISNTPSSWDSFSGKLQVGETAALANYSSGSNVQTILGVNTYYQSGYKSIKGGADAGYINVSNSGFSYNRATSQPTAADEALNYVKHFNVDSLGRVTMPYQPAWCVSRTSGDTTTGNTIQFNSINTNIGNIYNSSTGAVTLPVSGRYLIQFFTLGENNSITNEFEIRVNGSRLVAARDESKNNLYETFGTSLVVNLSANDSVSVYCSAGSIYGFNDAWNRFSGYLVG